MVRNTSHNNHINISVLRTTGPTLNLDGMWDLGRVSATSSLGLESSHHLVQHRDKLCFHLNLKPICFSPPYLKLLSIPCISGIFSRDILHSLIQSQCSLYCSYINLNMYLNKYIFPFVPMCWSDVCQMCLSVR